MAKTHTTTQPKPETDTALEHADVWHVVVMNDPVNLMSYVVLVFKKVLGFPEAKARVHMMEVHEKGRSVVWSGHREKAEAYAYSLREWNLTAVLESDEKN